MAYRGGRHFLKVPGSCTTPHRLLRAMDMPAIDHRGRDVAELSRAVTEGCQRVFQTRGPVAMYPSAGTGAWESALVNCDGRARERPCPQAVGCGSRSRVIWRRFFGLGAMETDGHVAKHLAV
jgi:hypothetical protein